MHADGFAFQTRLAVPKYNQMRHRSVENQNSDGGNGAPISVTHELLVRGRIRAFKFSCAVGEREQEHGVSVCVPGNRRVLCPCEPMSES